MYGIDHGGEVHASRCFWPGRPVPKDPLVKLQAKHVAPYVMPSMQTGVLALHVDSDQVVPIIGSVWRAIHQKILAALPSFEPVPIPVIRKGLLARQFEPLTQAVFHVRLMNLLADLGDATRHPFWPLFIGALHV